MTIEELQGEFAAAVQDFEAADKTAPSPKPPSRNFVSRWFGTLTLNLFRASSLTLREARRSIRAAHSALRKLADATNSASELQQYVNAMRALTAELTEVVNRELQDSEAAYAPITQRFRAAAGTLRQAHARAKQQAAALGLAADVITAFSRLVAVL